MTLPDNLHDMIQAERDDILVAKSELKDQYLLAIEILQRDVTTMTQAQVLQHVNNLNTILLKMLRLLKSLWL